MELKPFSFKSCELIQMEGEFDLYEASKMKEFLEKYLRQRQEPLKLILDMQKIEYMDSSGLGTLIHLQSEISRLKGKLIICGLHGSPKKVLELTRLGKFFTLCDNLDHAKQAMEN